MTTDLDLMPVPRQRPLRLDWLGPLFWRPRQILARVLEQTSASWLAPLLLLSLMAVVTVLIAGPIRQAAAASGPQALPQDFQYWSPEQQNRYTQSLAAAAGPAVTYLLPLASELLKVWLSWFLLAAVLHLVLTLAGSRGTMTTALNLAAWASLPFALRYLIQAGAMLATHQLVGGPGLAGFAPAGSDFLARYLGAAFPFIDLYLVWMIILLLVGLIPSAGIPAGKAWASVLISVAIVLLLQALPGFASAQLSGLGSSRGFLPFGF